MFFILVGGGKIYSIFVKGLYLLTLYVNFKRRFYYEKIFIISIGYVFGFGMLRSEEHLHDYSQ